MGRQSSRLYFQGKDHKDIYYNGHYHDAMYLSDSKGNVTLVWEKLKRVPLEGFTAICYYNDYFYVAHYRKSHNDILIYQGESLDKLEYIYATNIYGLGTVIFWADKSGFTMLRDGICFWNFSYRGNKKLDISTYSKNVNEPINFTENNNISFFFRQEVWYADTKVSGNQFYPVLYGNEKNIKFMYRDSGIYEAVNTTFIYNKSVIFPIQILNNSNKPTLAEKNYIHIIVISFEENNYELKKVEFPFALIDALYNAGVEEYDKYHPTLSSGITKKNAMLTYDLNYNMAISSGYLIYQCINIGTSIEYSGYKSLSERFVDLKINLNDFTIFFRFRDTDEYGYISAGFATNDGFLSVIQGTEGENNTLVLRLRYILMPSYDFEIYVRDIENIEILGSNEAELENKLYFTASYHNENYVYFSIQNLNDYLLELNLETKTGAIIKPELYLKE